MELGDSKRAEGLLLDGRCLARDCDRTFSCLLRSGNSDSPLWSTLVRASQRFSLMYSCMTCRRTWVELTLVEATLLLSMNWNRRGGLL